MNYETITIKPLTGALGAEISGLDLRKPLSNQQRSELHDAFLAHCAIYVRDQDLDPDDMLRYGRYFAEPTTYPCRGHPRLSADLRIAQGAGPDRQCRRRLAFRHD